MLRGIPLNGGGSHDFKDIPEIHDLACSQVETSKEKNCHFYSVIHDSLFAAFQFNMIVMTVVVHSNLLVFQLCLEIGMKMDGRRR